MAKGRPTKDKLPPTPNEMNGRPAAIIDWKLFERACSLGCTQRECANLCNVDDTTLAIRATEHYKEPFATVYQRLIENAKMSLRHNLFQQAQNGSTQATLFLAKSFCKMRETTFDEEVELYRRKAAIDKEMRAKEDAQISAAHAAQEAYWLAKNAELKETQKDS